MSSTITTTLPINGMTCGHCVQAVTSELTQLDGVQDVAVELVPDGTSRVTVTSAAPLDDAVVRAAIDEAGYGVAR
jgi:copper chaperone